MADTHTHDHAGLDVHIERKSPCLASVRFSVTPEETNRSRQVGLRNYGKQTRMKGFRPGKVPLHVLEKQFGAEVDRQLVEHFCQDALRKAISEHDLKPAASPRIDLESLQLSTEESWGHEFELLLRPDIELGEIEGLKIEGQPLAVTDEEFEATLQDVRRQMSIPEPAGEEGLEVEGMAVCKLSFVEEGGEESLLDREGIRMNPRTPPPGVDPETFEKEMTGTNVGDSRTFELEFGEDFPDEAVRGKRGTCRIEVTEAFRIVPPTDERVFEEFGVQDEDGLQAEIRTRIKKAKAEQEDRRIEQALLERIIREHPMDLPEPLIEDQAQAKLAEMQQALEGQGVEGEELDARLAEEHKQAYQGAAHAMRAIYLIEEIARKKELQVTEKDLQAEFESIAARNGVPIDDVRKYYQEEHLLQQLALELLERNVRSFLRESADIQEAVSAD